MQPYRGYIIGINADVQGCLSKKRVWRVCALFAYELDFRISDE